MAELEIVKAGPGLSVQDLGRAGHLHAGLPSGGALVPEWLRAAHQALGNDPSVAALEVFLHPVTLRSTSAMTISVNGRTRTLAPGIEQTFDPAPAAVAYLALPGGVDVPEWLGSRSTLVSAGLGGLEGRMLRAGDRVRAIAPEPVRQDEIEVAFDDGPIRIVPGPDAFPIEAMEGLLAATFTIDRRLDRTGLRLEGAKLPVPGDRPFSTPMIRGAIQVSRDGTPIVLGPDHPTTGGYAVIATVSTRDLGRLSKLRPGAPVRFTLDPGPTRAVPA